MNVEYHETLTKPDEDLLIEGVVINGVRRYPKFHLIEVVRMGPDLQWRYALEWPHA